MMRIVLAIMVYLVSGSGLLAQDRYFLCVQTENKQPFYVRITNQTYGSSKVGNLVVPSLGDSTYQLAIGFPDNKYPEQPFLVTFNRKDLGFTLKQSGSQWVLENWANGETQFPRTDLAQNNKMWFGEKKKDDAFTALMAAVVNDTAVLYVASVMNIPGKQEVLAKTSPAVSEPVLKSGLDSNLASGAKLINADSVVAHAVTEATVADSLKLVAQASSSATDSASLVEKPAVASIDSNVVIVSKAAAADSAAILLASAAGKDSSLSSVSSALVNAGEEMVKAAPILVYTAPAPSIEKLKDIAQEKTRTLVYKDSSAGSIDTISVIIDLDAAQLVAAVDPMVAPNLPPDNTPEKKSASADTGLAVLKEVPVAKATSIGDAESDKRKLVLINSDCANFASEHDVDKLRVKLMDEPTIDSKLNAARKLLKSKCMYTRQIKALSELFMNDEGKYKFFELSYPFTADTTEFRQLIGLLSEDVYIARFKTLVRMKD